MARTTDLAGLTDRVAHLHDTRPSRGTLLVAISGIDGSGKGYLTARLDAELQARGHRVASLNIDGWLNLPFTRFNAADPPGHFYRNAIRFGDMFAQLVLPLRDTGSVEVTVDHVEETATAYARRTYAFRDIDIILLEGIYLLGPEYAGHYDLSVWIDCSFDTALERAIRVHRRGCRLPRRFGLTKPSTSLHRRSTFALIAHARSLM